GNSAGQVFFRNGTYVLNSSIIITGSGLHIEGESKNQTVFIPNNSSMKTFDIRTSNVTFNNLYFNDVNSIGSGTFAWLYFNASSAGSTIFGFRITDININNPFNFMND